MLNDLNIIGIFYGTYSAIIDPEDLFLKNLLCRECDKCVIGFHHHCFWLNNCIGSINYKNFLQPLLKL